MKKILLIILLFVLTLSATQRIVSLSPSITEIVFALGKGESLVATSSYSLYPKEAQSLPIVGGYENPNIEKIIALRPTLVIGQSFNANTLQKLQKFHVKTLTVNLKTLQEIQDSILKIGVYLRTEREAKELTNAISNAIIESPKSKTPHSVMIVYGLREDLRNRTYIAGHDIFFEDVIEACGNTNAYVKQSANQPILGYENIIAINPDQIIILHSRATEPNVNVKKALQNWYAIPTNASRNRAISIVDEDYSHIPSHRVALTIKRLCGEMND